MTHHFHSLTARRARRSLDAVPGLELRAGHRAVFESSGVALDVCIEDADRIRLSAPAAALPAEDALRVNGLLPGNLRYARLGARLVLVADTQLDGVDHLANTLDEIAVGIKHASDRPSAATGDEPARERVESAVTGLGWPDEAIVRHDDTWELRPRVQGAAAPAGVALEPGGLRVRRTVLRAAPEAGARREALAECALQWNARIRLARVVLDGRAVTVESRLRSELVSTHWIGELARAVATGSFLCRLPLTVLAAQERAAECFLAALSATRPNPNPERNEVHT